MAQQQLFMDLAAHPQAILDAMDGMRTNIETIERKQKTTGRIVNISRLVLFLFGLLLTILQGNPLFVFVAIFIIFASLFVYRPKKIPAKSRFEAAYKVIHALRDDVGQKGALVGRLDFSPVNEKTKLLRTGRSSHGNTKYYYRDPWFIAKLKLVDGNIVKLELEERAKEKKGSIVARAINFKNKVVINPNVYEPIDRYDPTQQPVMTSSGGLDVNQLNVQIMLEDLKSLYTKARPVVTPPAGPPPTFDVAPTETPPVTT
jgi:hypothetical protein